MKKVLCGIFILGLTSLFYAQELQTGIKEIHIEGVTVIPVLNNGYRNLAYQGVISNQVKNLIHEVAQYDVTKAPGFMGSIDNFKVIFRHAHGIVVAYYANNGQIIRTTEKFKNIVLPFSVRRAACKNYPNYAIHSTKYLVHYNGENAISKLYHVQMKKDNELKKLKLDMEGNIIN